MANSGPKKMGEFFLVLAVCLLTSESLLSRGLARAVCDHINIESV